MLFSQRYLRALERRSSPSKSRTARAASLWSWLTANDASICIQRDRNDGWMTNSSILAERNPSY